MAGKYKKPFVGDYFGFPIYFRIEDRNGYPTILLSYRENGRLIYKHPPRRVKEPPEPSSSLAESLPHRLMEEFFQGLLSLDTTKEEKQGLKLRKSLEALPLAALLDADTYELFTRPKPGRKDSSIEDDMRAIRQLRKHEGKTPWQKVIPSKCSQWMYKPEMNDHARASVKRIMRSLFLRQQEFGIISKNPWIRYDPNDASRPHQKRTASIHANIDQTILTDGQCQALLAPVEQAVQDGRVTGIDMALLLQLTLALPLDEICAMNLDDFHPLLDFPGRLTVDITHHVIQKDGQQSFRWLPLSDPYRVRMLPLSAYVQRVFERYKEIRCAKGVPASDLPLVPTRSNAQRRMRPKEIQAELEKRFAGIPHQETVPEIGRHPSLHTLLAKTAPRELRKSGMEDEEIRFLLGQAPKLVSAKNYADFHNESELNKLGALQDRWLGRIWPEPLRLDRVSSAKLTGKNVGLQYNALKEHTQVKIQIDIPAISDPAIIDKLSDDGIWLELSALYGFSGFMVYRLPSGKGDTE